MRLIVTACGLPEVVPSVSVISRSCTLTVRSSAPRQGEIRLPFVFVYDGAHIEEQELEPVIRA